MKRSVFYGVNDIRIENAARPSVKKNEILVEVKACGVCGTDVHIYHGERGSAEVTPPIVLGHEFSGIVVEIGEEVNNFKVGDKVTVDPNIYCGRCAYCRNGKKQLCESLHAIGVNQDGGFQEYCVVPQTQAFLLEEFVSFEEGAMAEPVACCLHGIERSEIKEGDTVCVIGGGAIGLIMVQLAKLKGASKVILSEPVEMRRRIGLQVGADAVVDPASGNLKEQIKKVIGEDYVDVVIECVGRLAATRQAFEIAGKGAGILLFSVPETGAEFPLPLFDIYQKELKISGSFINPDTHLRAVKLINSRKLQIAPIITHKYCLEEVNRAIQMQMSNDSIKVLIVPKN